MATISKFESKKGIMPLGGKLTPLAGTFLSVSYLLGNIPCLVIKLLYEDNPKSLKTRDQFQKKIEITLPKGSFLKLI